MADSDSGEADLKNTKDLVKWVIQDIEARHEASQSGKSYVTGIPTGLPDIDKATDGLHAGVCVVASRSDKISLMDFGLTIVSNAVDHYKIGYVSAAGIPAEQIMKRLIGLEARVSLKDINEGFLANRDFPRLTTAAGKFAHQFGNNFLIHDGRLNDVYDFCHVAQTMQDRGAQLIILDNFDALVPRERIEGTSLYERCRHISGKLHDLASEYGLALMVYAKTKKGTSGEGKFSTEHLRDWGALEEARPIFLLDRERSDEEEWEREEQDAMSVNLHIANNIKGIGRYTEVPLIYLHSWGRFENAACIFPDNGSYSRENLTDYPGGPLNGVIEGARRWEKRV